jgi:hypothetical protein
VRAGRAGACAITALALALGASSCSKDDHAGTADVTSTTTGRGGTTTSAGGRTTTTEGSVTGTQPPPTGPVSSNTLPPVAVGRAAPLDDHIFVTVTKIEARNLGARGPGEVAGPGIVATVVVRNDTRERFDLDGLVVNAYYGQRTPASPNYVPNAALSGFVAPGQRKTGDYTFRIGNGDADTVVIEIEHSSTPNVVIVDNTAGSSANR